MLKATEHCMPTVTPSKSRALKDARIYSTVDRCDRIKGFSTEDFIKKGFISYRDIEKEAYRYTIPKEIDHVAKFSKKIRKKPFEDLLSVDEIDLIIRQKFHNERYSIQELFKISDTHRKGFVTKESFLKIIISLCGNLKIDHFYKLLERYQLNRKSVITFADVEKAFGSPSTSKFPPPIIFHGMGQPFKVSSAFALHLLKEAALDNNFDLKAILPESCFEEIILMDQFREALNRIKINLCDEDFTRLWIKIDTKGVGSIPFKKLLFLLNLQHDGKPMCGLRSDVIPFKRQKIKHIIRPKPPLKYINCYEFSNKISEPDIKAGGVSFPVIKGHKWKPKGPGGSNDYAFGDGSRFSQAIDMIKENRPQFKSVFDKLSYIFEEPYQEMLLVFKHFDPKCSGMVSLDAGLNILSEYDFKIEYDNFLKFLSKINCLDLNSGMDYQKMLYKFQTKGAGTCVNRIISHIIFAQKQSSSLKSLQIMSVEEIEERFYKILHKDFINFQSQLEKDSIDYNFINETDIKIIIENHIGNSMSQEQWDELQNYFDFEKSVESKSNENARRLINFRMFLAKFNKPTGICRYRLKYDLENSDLLDKKSTVNKDLYDPPRDFALLCRFVADKLQFRFHAIDKIYKSFENKLQGTLTKEILYELLNSQGCNLTHLEMNIIWEIVECQPNHQSWHYRHILKHLMINLYKKAQDINVESRKLIREDSNINVFRAYKIASKKQKFKGTKYNDRKIDMALKIKFINIDLDKTKKTIEKISPLMKSIWVPFKKQIRQIDIVGNTTIELHEMKDLLIKNGFILTDDEMNNLLNSFDRNKDGRFYYIQFLNEFTKFNPDEGKIKPSLHFDRVRHQLLNQKTGEKITVTETYKAMRRSLIEQWKSLIRAFKKLDTYKTGKLDSEQINKILISAGIYLSKDDLYHVFSGFDKDLDGKIDYVEFVEQLLDVFVVLPH